jgi:hypothetical protein
MENYRFVAFIVPELKTQRWRYASQSEKAYKQYALRLCTIKLDMTGNVLVSQDIPALLYTTMSEAKEYFVKLQEALQFEVLHSEDLKLKE